MEGLLIHIGDNEIFIHQTIVIWICIGIVVTCLLVYVGNKFKNADPRVAPKGILLVFEQLVHISASVISGNLNKQTWTYLPFMGTIMLMMVISNLMGLIGLQVPTSNLTLVITLVMMMIILIHFTDLKKHGFKGKFKSLCEPIPFLLPLNILGDIAFPISLSLRLFGNMLGGSIIVSLLYLLIQSLLPWGGVLFAVTPFLHMYFDVFTAFMQTYIFFMLASFFLSESSDAQEED